MRTLVTGAAGFIGFHVSRRLLERGGAVVGVDNLNDYYDVGLKEARLRALAEHEGFTFRRASLEDRDAMPRLFEETRPDTVVNLAAQAGVRYSLENPHAYADSNLIGFLNVLEGCRHGGVKHLVFASSSSVYGSNKKVPFSVDDNVDHPLSLYAATKKANELMAHSYSSVFGLPVTGLRFFSVYGPWGRPDSVIHKFTTAILNDEPIDVYNHGKMWRDFTFVDDVAEGVIRTLDRPPVANPDWQGAVGASFAPYRVYNIGNNCSVELSRFIEVLEGCLGRPARRNLLPFQPGDIPVSFADVSALVDDVGFRPKTSIEEGIPRFVEWYRSYYGA